MAGEKRKPKRPKDLLFKPSQFGRVEGAPWRDVPDEERHRLGAAYFQHRVALHVKRAIDLDPHLTLESFAARVGMTPDTLRRKLYGTSVVSLAEIVALADVAGVDVLPVIQSREDLFPHRAAPRPAETE